MKYKAILFDMDGTLVPMDMNVFTQSFIGKLLQKVSHPDIPAEVAMKNTWKGIHAMINNDGAMTNEAVFIRFYQNVYGDALTQEIIEQTTRFYKEDFCQVKADVGENPLAAEAIRLAHEKADLVILATNPLFPMIAQEERLHWVNLQQEDFDLITSYENSSFSKPNPEYYHMICAKMGISPSECLMIGNDEKEDMQTAAMAGMDGYLITDCLIPCSEYHWEGPRGSFSEMLEYLRAL